MILQSEDKLVAGKSVLLDRHGELLRFDRYDDSERRAFMTGIADGQVRLLVPRKMTLIGTLTPDGWIEGEWAENPVPGMAVRVRGAFGFDCGEVASEKAHWPSVAAFRPAHREAQPETDGGGELAPLMAKLADEIAEAADRSDATPMERFVAEALTSDDAKSKRLVEKVWVVSLPDARKAIAAIDAWEALLPTPEGQTEGAVDLYVPGPVWLEPEITDEDDNPIWTSEVQTIGGHSVIATVHGGSPSEAALRRDVILAALASKGV